MNCKNIMVINFSNVKKKHYVMKTQQIKNKKYQHFNTNLENITKIKILQKLCKHLINDCQRCEYKILYTFFSKIEKFCQLKIV